MTAESLLQRCDKVRETAPGNWVACCPAHEDRSPSLAIKECDDGRVLIHCFAGCEVEDVLGSAGLRFSDIMPERIGTDHSCGPQKWLNPKDALSSIDHESLVVSIIGADFLESQKIDEDTWSRLALAVSRISDTRTKIAPARISK